MNDQKDIRTPIHPLIDQHRHPSDDDWLPLSRLEPFRVRPTEVGPAVQDARNALRRQRPR
jgi:hypothetical protein